MPRVINPAGLAVIKEAEGFTTHAYTDGGGVLTIGYGHTRGVKMGDSCTPAQETALVDSLMGSSFE